MTTVPSTPETGTGILQATRRIELSLPFADYTRPISVKVSLDAKACGTFEYEGQKFTLKPADCLTEAMKSKFHPEDSGTLTTTLADIVRGAARYYRDRTDVRDKLAILRAKDREHILAYEFGLAFGWDGSHFCHMDKVHSEIRGRMSELFAYGLALNVILQVFKLPVERFYFVLNSDMVVAGNANKPDFRTEINPGDFSDGTLMPALVSKTGEVIYLDVEVKGLSERVSFGGKLGEQGTPGEASELLWEIYKKSKHVQGQFLAIIANAPKKKNVKTGCQVIFADPGEPKALQREEQCRIILSGLLTSALQIGLWTTCWHIIRWLIALGENDTQFADLLQWLEANNHAARKEFVPLTEKMWGQEFGGRSFSELLMLVDGRKADGAISKEEAQMRLDQEDWGQLWYAGIDKRVIDAVSRQDAAAMTTILTYHSDYSYDVGETPSASLIIQYTPETHPEDYHTLVAGIKNVLRIALSRW